MRIEGRWCVMALGLGGLCGVPGHAQQPDSTIRTYALPGLTVSAARTTLPLAIVPRAVGFVDRQGISRGRPTWGLDEALASVPGVFVANRYNFSLDQRISIRGFGSRSAFAVRGIKILLDGVPQTLPDGQGQLTNLELGEVDRIEVLRGSASALFGNASGGVISIQTDPDVPERVREEARFVAGRFSGGSRAWNKMLSITAVRVGAGAVRLTASRLSYQGERDHSGADLRNANLRLQLPAASGWTVAANADIGDTPKADNPGSLTLDELGANRNSAPAINLSSHAGKDVTQLQGGVSIRRALGGGGEAGLAVFGLTRDLKNPTTFAFVDLDRLAYGARASLTRPLGGAGAPQLTTGLDVQRQHDVRVNYGNNAGRPDSTRSLDQVEDVTEAGPFIQTAVSIAPWLTVTAGVRYDWVRFRVADHLVAASNPDDSGDRLMRAPSGSLGLVVNRLRGVTVYANVASSFETPTTTELANRPDTAGGFNAALEPQHAWTYELGARGTDGRGSWSIVVFRANVTDELISYEVPTSPQRRFFRNAGSARHLGLEAGGEVSIVDGLTLGGAYTYADYRYVRYAFSPDSTHRFILDGRALPGIPKHLVHLAAQVSPRHLRGWWAEVETNGASGYSVDDTLLLRTSAWWATNVRLGWEGAVAGVRVAPFLAVNNLTNRLYVGSVVVNAARGRYYEPAPGRNFSAGLSVGAGRPRPP